ncbi:MAG: hypothetical protein NZ750_09310 [Anaerolineae bacterium]|nr:hypothetical protein [Anaerolineae bacterium]MDW8171817.1 hypothetical protein [Anaerolineae bacterium]
MPSLPRIVTVDPSGTIPSQVRGALDLMDRLAIQIDVPSAIDALDEVKRGACTIVISAWEPGDRMPGWELAAKIKQIAQETAIVIIADYDDTELDEEMRSASPFVYLKRPFPVQQFLRVLTAALDGEDVFAALHEPASQASGPLETYSPVPTMNIDRAKEIVHRLMGDLSAMAVLLATREGQVLIEQGVIGMNRDEMTRRVTPAVISNVDMRDILGGNASMLQFYDGEAYDVFVLSVGLHHFLVVIFEGTKGARELGAVSRYGRRCAEDLIALLGADAWFIQRVTQQASEASKAKAEAASRARRVVKKEREDDDLIVLERAAIAPTPAAQPVVETKPSMQAIEGELDLDLLFGASAPLPEADDLFSLDALAAMSSEEERASGGKLGWEQARELGLLDS